MVKYLRRNCSTASPGSVVFLSVETSVSGPPIDDHRRLHKLLFGCAVYCRLEDGKVTRRKEVTFATEDEFWLWFLNVSQPDRPTWLFCHNVGFAMTVLEFWQTLHDGEWRIRDDDFPDVVAARKKKGLGPWRGFYVDADPPTIISCKHKSGQRAFILDLQNYWPIALDDLAEKIGICRLPEPTGTVPDSVRIAHCMRDVEITERAMLGLIAWVKDNDYGMFRYTASGQAMAAFRHRFYDKGITLDRPDEVRKLERAGYFGGRIEMLYEGEYEGTVYELDVQGFFPSIMAEEYAPRELISSWLDSLFFRPQPIGPGRFSLAEVLIETYNATYPVRLKDCTLYPHGRYWTVLCGRELELAFQRQHVVTIGRWATYKLSRMFGDFVDHFWSKRQTAKDRGDGLEELLCKLMMNSLYGKWGQLTPVWTECGPNDSGPLWGQRPEIDFETKETTLVRYVGHYMEKLTDRQDHPQSFVAICAWITAAARERMRRFVGVAGREHTMYVAFDALFVDKLGFQRLWNAGEIKPGQMGKLKIKSYATGAHFRGYNNYTIGSKKVMSGRKPNAVDLGDWAYTQDVVQGIAGTIFQKPIAGVESRTQLFQVPKTRRRWEDDGEHWTTPLLVTLDKPRHLDAIRTGKYFALEEIR